MRTRITILILCLAIAIASLFSVGAVAEGKTSVTIRVCYYSVGQYYATTVIFNRYRSMDSQEPYTSLTFDEVQRADLHELTVELEPGFYDVIAFPMGSWSAQESGQTQRFEVRGDIMTVYVACDIPEYKAPMPPEWLVYGEDNQEFSIWGAGSLYVPPETTNPSDDPSDPTTTIPPEDLPDHNTEAVPITDPTPSVPSPPDQTEPSSTIDDTPSSNTGTLIFTAFLLLSVVVCVIILIRLKRKRGA